VPLKSSLFELPLEPSRCSILIVEFVTAKPIKTTRQTVPTQTDERMLMSPAAFGTAVCFALLTASTVAAAGEPLSPLLTDSLSAWTLWAARISAPREAISGYGESGTDLGKGRVQYGFGIPLTVGRDWASWCCGYHDQIVWTGWGSSQRRLSLYGLSAFGFFIEPKARRTERFLMTLSDGRAFRIRASGAGGAHFFGYTEFGHQLLIDCGFGWRLLRDRGFSIC
jgi:hypothetical protein